MNMIISTEYLEVTNKPESTETQLKPAFPLIEMLGITGLFKTKALFDAVIKITAF